MSRELPSHWEHELRELLRDEPSAAPADLGWDDYARAMGLVPPAPRSRGLSALVASWQRAVQMRPALTGAGLLLLIGHFVWTVLPPSAPPEEPIYRSAAVPAPAIEVRFKSTATEYEMRKVLLSLDASIAMGPSQLGDYRLRVSADRIETVRQALAAHPLVDKVSVLDPQDCCGR